MNNYDQPSVLSSQFFFLIYYCNFFFFFFNGRFGRQNQARARNWHYLCLKAQKMQQLLNMKFSIYQRKRVHFSRKAIRSVIHQQTTLVPPLKLDGKLSIELYETLHLHLIGSKKAQQERMKSFMIKYKHC